MTSTILFNQVSVKFRVYSNPTPSVKESVLDLILSRLKSVHRYHDFYALRNINLTIRKGDRLGVIGLNGAGKSTLLKNIAQIYPPTEGKITIRGKVTPLMELGAGFDPEQTGRENIFLNGSLLGYSDREMKEIEKGIIDFAEIDEFIDVPVKYYSSGMYVRLAFSIATMVNPQILLLDEILAAGDTYFTQKAYKKINSLINIADIVVFVSHDLEEVKNLCNRVIVLDSGKIINDGDPNDMVTFYKNMINRPK